MRLDIRTPLGTLFLVLGLILLAYGGATLHSPAYARSLGINLNLASGCAMSLFGAALLIAVYRGRAFRD